MPAENGAPAYRNRYIRREPGFKAPDPAMSGGVRAIMLSPGSAGAVKIYQRATGVLWQLD
jgi:hypothetical protein